MTSQLDASANQAPVAGLDSVTGRPLKLAIIGSRGFPSTYGGYETLVRHLAPYLVQAGHDVTVYCRDRDQGRREWLEEGVHCVAPLGLDTKSLSTLSFGFTSAMDARTRGLDAALVLNIANGFFLPYLRRVGVPCAVNTDGVEWEREKWSRVGRAVFRAGAAMTARSADRLVADSEAIADIWLKRFGIPSTFIPYGTDVPTNPGHDRLSPLGLEPDRYLLVVARLIPENNVELTLEAARGVASPETPLVVVGSANFESPLERELLARQHDGTVKWLGHVSDQELLLQLWANCAIYVHGHSVGGTNPALLQALGAGAPTLAFHSRFNEEVLREPDQLYEGSVEALRRRLRNLLGDEGLRGRMRARGPAIVSERYRWSDVCAGYERVLSELAETSARVRR